MYAKKITKKTLLLLKFTLIASSICLFFKHKKKRIIKFIEENWINTLVLLAFKLTHKATTNKNKFCNEVCLKTIKCKYYLLDLHK